ncbi:MAG: hypothetical protein H7210_04010, partial [Pyrinomonadaceae bacterium]|nr:hypothetical protein [Phycisphaerales bacterium]
VKQLPVQKTGCATGLTFGFVYTVLASLRRGRSTDGSRSYSIPDVLEIVPDARSTDFCDRGDSGSVVWDDPDPAWTPPDELPEARPHSRPPRPVALVFSTAKMRRTYAIPIQRVLDDLEVTICTR